MGAYKDEDQTKNKNVPPIKRVKIVETSKIMNSTIAFGQNYKFDKKEETKSTTTKSTVAFSFNSKEPEQKTVKSEAKEVVKSIEKVLKEGPIE